MAEGHVHTRPAGGAALLVTWMIVLAGLTALVQLGTGPAEADGGNNVILSEYIVEGTETWDLVRVMGLGRLVVPGGATLNADDIILEPGSEFEMTGGTVRLSRNTPVDSVTLSGNCSRFIMTGGSVLNIYGSDGSGDMVQSHGAPASVNVVAEDELMVADSTIEVSGGTGLSIEMSWTSDPVGGMVCAGGNATIYLELKASLETLLLDDCSVMCSGGAGGDAADGEGPSGNTAGRGGGYSCGGDVGDRVGSGGDASIALISAGKLVVIDSELNMSSGDGGDAGDPAYIDYGPQAGGGGGGYSGGNGSRGLSEDTGGAGGDISGRVGSGGDATADLKADRKLRLDRTTLTLTGGAGGAAAEGGTSEAGGAGGGGGYSGGGGGSYYHGAGGDGGGVSGDVGRGGSARVDMDSGALLIRASTINTAGGPGGDAGDGGGNYTKFHENSGHGGGGYSGGGGGGEGSANGNTPGAEGGAGGPVSGYVGAGGEAAIGITCTSMDSDSSFTMVGGNGGDAGLAGARDKETVLREGGGGYSAGGGGGDGWASEPDEGGGLAGAVTGHNGDGGGVRFDVDCIGDCFISTISLMVLPGEGGLGNASEGEGLDAGQSTGRKTSDGAIDLTVPVAIPPVVIASPSSSCLEDHPYHARFDAYDPSGSEGGLTWDAVSLPEFLTFDAGPAVLTGTPLGEHVGDNSVSLSVTSTSGLKAYANFTLEVVNVNDPPEITSVHLGVGKVEVPYECNFTAYDPDPTNDTLTWYLYTSARFLYMDADTGRLWGTPGTYDYGDYHVNVTVMDDKGGSHSDLFTLNILDSYEQMNTSYSDLDVAFDEDTVESYYLPDLFWDRQGDNLTFSIHGGSHVEGRIDGNEWLFLIPDRDWAGSDSLILYADDGAYRSERHIGVIVRPVNDPPRDVSITFERRTFQAGREQMAWGDAYDPDGWDGGRLNFDWYVSGVGNVGSGQTVDLGLSAGDYVVTLTVSDGYTSVQVSREVSVLGDPDPPPDPPPKEDNRMWYVAVILISLVLTAFAVVMYRNMMREAGADSFTPRGYDHPEGPYAGPPEPPNPMPHTPPPPVQPEAIHAPPPPGYHHGGYPGSYHGPHPGAYHGPYAGPYGPEPLMPDEAYMGDDDWNGLKKKGSSDPDDEDGLTTDDDGLTTDDDEPWPVSEFEDDDDDDDDFDEDDDDAIDDDDADWETDGMWGEEEWDDEDGIAVDDRQRPAPRYVDDRQRPAPHYVDDRQRPAPRYPDQMEDELSRTRGGDWDSADAEEENWDDEGWPGPGYDLSGAHVVSGYEDSRRPPTREIAYQEERKGWVDGASSEDKVWDPEADRDHGKAGKPESAEPFRVKRPRKVVKVRRPRKIR